MCIRITIIIYDIIQGEQMCQHPQFCPFTKETHGFIEVHGGEHRAMSKASCIALAAQPTGKQYAYNM